MIEAVVGRCFVKKVFLKNSKNSQENTSARVSFLIKLQALGLLRSTLIIEHLWWLLLMAFFFFAKGKRVIKCNFVNIVVGIKIIFLWKCLSNCEVSFQKQPPEVFCEKSILKNFTKFKGKHLCWSLFLINLHASSPATLLKRDSNTGVFL